MTTWYALDMDEGMLAQGPTKRSVLAALHVRSYPICRIRRFSPGGYEVFYGYPGEDNLSQFDLMTKEVADRNGYDWAIEP